MDRERYSQWVKRSFRFIREEKDHGLPHHIQLLGIADAELRGVRPVHVYDANGKPREDEHGILMLEWYQMKAHLWLLGAYELARMLSQRLREHPEYADPSSIETVHQTKRLLERVRVPLAKLEPASRHEKTDCEVAHAGIGDRGLGWLVADGVFIYQEELSDALYEMLTSMRVREL